MDQPMKPGEWFLAVNCDCGAWIVIDASDGPTQPLALPETIDLKCDACGRLATYPQNRVRHSRIASTPQGGGMHPDAAASVTHGG